MTTTAQGCTATSLNKGTRIETKTTTKPGADPANQLRVTTSFTCTDPGRALPFAVVVTDTFSAGDDGAAHWTSAFESSDRELWSTALGHAYYFAYDDASPASASSVSAPVRGADMLVIVVL